MFHFIYVIHLGHKIQKNGKFTGILANNFINKCKNIEIQERLHYLSNQVQNNYPEPSCGFFKFDWPYFYTVGSFFGIGEKLINLLLCVFFILDNISYIGVFNCVNSI